MKETKRVSILAVRFGNGHWQAAQVLKNAVEEVYPEVRVEVVNYLVFAGFFFDLLTRLGYHDLMIHIPWLYRCFFAFTNRLQPGSFFQKIINTCGVRRFLRYFRRRKPDLLITTFPIPTAVVSNLKRRGIIDCPLVTVVTDYMLHQQWLQPGTDLYIVANRTVADEMARCGVPAQQVLPLGIPVDPRFGEATGGGIARLFPDFSHLEGLPLVLVINGATSFGGDLGRICRLLADFPVPLLGVVLAVNYPRRRLALRRMVSRGRNKVFITGFSRQVPELMEAAACLICKAGGITVSEALARELPMLIYRPLPCQEEKNRDFLTESGAALTAQNISELADGLHLLLTEPGLRLKLQQAASCLKRPAAARDAADALRPYLERSFEARPDV